MDLEDLLFAKEGHVGIVTLNRPDKLNALSPGITQGLSKVAREVRNDPDVRVLVITGAGRAFCAGGDVRSFRVATDNPPPPPPVRAPHPEDAWQVAFTQCERPIIGAINGYAIGAGFGLALSCDIRIASDKAVFGVAQTKRGRRPDGGLNFLLPRIVGVEKALELMWTGDFIDAPEALRIGAISRVVPADDLIPAALALAQKVAAGPSVAQALAKRMVYKSIYPEAAQIAAAEMEYYTGLLIDMTEDAREGARSFLEKREAVFKGR